jgi:hypothetical protein
LLIYKAFPLILIFSLQIGAQSNRLALSLGPGNDAAILTKIDSNLSQGIHYGEDGAALPAHCMGIEAFKPMDHSSVRNEAKRLAS